MDAIEWSKEPDEFTFKPEILGDRRAGKIMPLFGDLRLNNQTKKGPKLTDEDLERDISGNHQ